MRLDKFWEFVKENPWFLSLFRVENYVSTEVNRGSRPENLGVFLTKTIPEGVDWIAPRPWSDHVLQMKTEKGKDGNPKFTEDRVPGKHTIQSWTWIVIFWHGEHQCSFANYEDLPVDRCVKDAVDLIRRMKNNYEKVYIDAVVLIHDKRTTPWRHCNALHSKAFELYFPRKKRKLGVPDPRDSHISNLY